MNFVIAASHAQGAIGDGWDTLSPRRPPGLWCSTVAATLASVIVSSAQGQWSAASLHPTNATSSYALCTSGGHQGGYADFNGFQHASLWSGTAASRVDLSPSGRDSRVYGLSDGQQVGSALFSGGSHAALWSGTAASFVDLNPAGATISTARAIDGGQQVGTASIGGSDHAGLWSGTAASWADLNPTTALDSVGLGISNGQQVGRVRLASSGSTAASLWIGTAVSWVNLNPAGASSSTAFGVCNGQQVGSAYFTGAPNAGRWRGTATSWVNLNPAGVAISNALGTDGIHQVGDAYVAFGEFKHASLWSGTAASWVDLHSFLPPGYTESTADGVWSDASFIYVAGYARKSTSTNMHAFLWTLPIPAPGTTTVCVIGVMLPYGRRRNR